MYRTKIYGVLDPRENTIQKIVGNGGTGNNNPPKPKYYYEGAGTYYLGNIEYSFDIDRSNESQPILKRISNAEGYFANNNFYYYRRDHLGNNREVWNATQNQTAQITNYYPSGLPWKTTQAQHPDLQPYKFGGKEFVEDYGYDVFDYGARGMYPAIGRFTSIDPLCEKYYSISPYAYCAGNPIKYIDPDGRFIGTAIGTIIGGIAGGISAYINNTDVWAGAAEGAVAGLITGAAVDLAIATGGTGLALVGTAVAYGTMGGALGGVAGDITGQIVSQRREENITISNENFANKAYSGAIGGAINGLTGGIVGALSKASTASTNAVIKTMSQNITTTAKTLTAQGATQSTVDAVIYNISEGMKKAAVENINKLLQIEIRTAAATAAAVAKMDADKKAQQQQQYTQTYRKY